MSSFLMNGYLWHLVPVRKDSGLLVDRTGVKRIATTDPSTRCVYISQGLERDLYNRVLRHELTHVSMFCYNLIPEVEFFTYPDRQIQAEEWICNFIADHGKEIFDIAIRLGR